MHAQEPLLDRHTVQIPRLLRAVGPGWHAVLYRLHDQLVALCPGYRALGVKEKFGGRGVRGRAMTYLRGGSRRCATTATAPGPPARS